MPADLGRLARARPDRVRASLHTVSDIRRKPGYHVLSCNGVRGRLAKH